VPELAVYYPNRIDFANLRLDSSTHFYRVLRWGRKRNLFEKGLAKRVFALAFAGYDLSMIPQARILVKYRRDYPRPILAASVLGYNTFTPKTTDTGIL
jgi:hypothetical protein